MNETPAFTEALAYAWGREDASGTATAGPSESVTCIAFATAYAEGIADYDGELRTNMPPLRPCYDRWQETNGGSIFPEGETTQEQVQRRAGYRLTAL